MTSLAILRWRACQAIDQAAGEARLRYITGVPGQEAVYMLKLSEAQSYVAAQAADPAAPVPAHITAEASATAVSPLLVAQNIVALAAIWNQQLSPAIEGNRLGGKKAVASAGNEADVDSAQATALAALAAI